MVAMVNVILCFFYHNKKTHNNSKERRWCPLPRAPPERWWPGGAPTGRAWKILFRRNSIVPENRPEDTAGWGCWQWARWSRGPCSHKTSHRSKGEKVSLRGGQRTGWQGQKRRQGALTITPGGLLSYQWVIWKEARSEFSKKQYTKTSQNLWLQVSKSKEQNRYRAWHKNDRSVTPRYMAINLRDKEGSRMLL